MFLVTLRYYASGNFLINIGDHSGVHYSSVSKAVKKVSRVIASLSQEYITMPVTNEEISSVKSMFYAIAKFPNCIGAVDCTHIKIQSPGGSSAELFRNRKGFFSINVQTVCNASLKICDIVCRWPGATHDSHIFNCSAIKSRLERQEFGNSLIVGDSGYGVKKYLITPLSNPTTAAENLFQESLVRTRNPVERCYGVWKRRFPVLATGIRLKKSVIESVIVATAVLHNIACYQREDVPPINDIQDEAINFVNGASNNPIVENRNSENRVTRNALISEYFQSIINNEHL